MKVQYAVFCESIDCTELPPTFRKPISNIVETDIASIKEFAFPLFITFIGGTEGKHTLSISVITPTRTIPISDRTFTWRGAATQGEIYPVNFQPDIFGNYIFKLSVDGVELHEVTIPIVKEKSNRSA